MGGLPVKMPFFPHGGTSDVLTVEAEWDVVWHDGPPKFLKCLSIQSEQERRSTLPIKDDCEDHTFVFARRTRGRDNTGSPGYESSSNHVRDPPL